MDKQPETRSDKLVLRLDKDEKSNRSQLRTWNRLRKSPSAMIGLTLIILLLLIALTANFIAPRK